MSVARLAVAAARAAAVAVSAAVLAAAYAAGRARPSPSDGLAADPPSLPPGRVLAIPGHGELFVRELAGPADGPVIVLLHGWMFPADVTWFQVYEPLSHLGRVLALDHRGHGRGSRPPQPFRLADAADDAAALLRHLGAGPAVAVGYSMGGPVAQLLWRRHPEVVRGLVLCATAATFSDTARERWQWRTMGVLQVVLRILPRATWERLVRAQARGDLPVRVTRMVHPGTPSEVLDLLPWAVGELQRGSPEDLAEAGRELGRFDARPWLGALDVPTHVLITAHDELVPASRQRELADLVPGAQMTELPMDHDAVVGASEEFVPALVEAVRKVAAAGEGSPAGLAGGREG